MELTISQFWSSLGDSRCAHAALNQAVCSMPDYSAQSTALCRCIGCHRLRSCGVFVGLMHVKCAPEFSTPCFVCWTCLFRVDLEVAFFGLSVGPDAAGGAPAGPLALHAAAGSTQASDGVALSLRSRIR